MLLNLFLLVDTCSVHATGSMRTLYKKLLFFIFCIQNCLEGERLEGISQSFVELAHELHPVKKIQLLELREKNNKTAQKLPVKTKGMEESRQTFHTNQDTDGQDSPRPEYHIDHNRSGVASGFQSNGEDHGIQHFGKL